MALAPMNEAYCFTVVLMANRLSSNVQYLFRKKLDVAEIAAPITEASMYHRFDNNLKELATSLAKRNEII